MFRAGLLLIIRRYYSVYAAVGICRVFMWIVMELLIFLGLQTAQSPAQDTSRPFHLSLVISVYLSDTLLLDRDGHIILNGDHPVV